LNFKLANINSRFVKSHIQWTLWHAMEIGFFIMIVRFLSVELAEHYSDKDEEYNGHDYEYPHHCLEVPNLFLLHFFLLHHMSLGLIVIIMALPPINEIIPNGSIILSTLWHTTAWLVELIATLTLVTSFSREITVRTVRIIAEDIIAVGFIPDFL